MRLALSVLAALALTAVLTPPAPAQSSIPYRRQYEATPGSYARVNLNFNLSQPTSARSSTTLGAMTSVNVPDGGEALIGGLGSASDGRNEFGSPLAGKVPLLNRGFRTVGYGKTIKSSKASIRVRIIRLAEEEERQTGVRP